MNIEKLYIDLTEAYSSENLNRITGKLIQLYQNKNFEVIREIANKVSKYVPIEEEKDAKCFSKLIMLYHPDRGEQFNNSIQQLYAAKDSDGLNKHAHILLLADIDDVKVNIPEEDIGYEPEYVWDPDDAYGFDFADPDDDEEAAYRAQSEAEMYDFERSFYNLIKIREYGTIQIDLPTYYLEDFEEFEMAYSGLETLDGVQFCTHVKILDISFNALTDIEKLWDLKDLEELYLSNNQVSYIDALGNLTNLRVLDLSCNLVDDISPLLSLENLSYVNLIGNYVPDHQIRELERKGVLVMLEYESSGRS